MHQIEKRQYEIKFKALSGEEDMNCYGEDIVELAMTEL